ncbi:hypothetical protein OK016_26215 [Vibrio chagasii]|nr:hypothetical protein [Vibrio chagasii]
MLKEQNDESLCVLNYAMDENVNGNYFEDKAFKRRFHSWLNNT